MVVRTLLSSMNFEGHISLRHKGNRLVGYIGGGTSKKLCSLYGYYTVVSTCIIDGVLIIYVE